MKFKHLLLFGLFSLSFFSNYTPLLSQDKVIWADQVTQSIYTSNFDGSDVSVIHGDQSVVRRLQYSAIEEKIYWVASADAAIRKSNLDGSDLETIFNSGSTSLNLIELDYTNTRILYTNSNDNYIRSVHFDGTNDQIVVTGIGTTQGLAFDAQNNFIYWTEPDNHRIRRADGNGDNPITIVQLSANANPFDLELDSTNQKLYFIDRGSTKGIYRVDTNGDNLEIINDSNGTKTVISLDLYNDTVYWTNGEFQFISSANLDGSDVNLIYMGTTQLSGLDVAPTPPVIQATSNISELSAAISLFPNPNIDMLNINLSSKNRGNIQITVINAKGEIVEKQTLKKESKDFTHQINVQQYPSGVYFLNVLIGDETLTKRFIHYYELPRP